VVYVYIRVRDGRTAMIKIDKAIKEYIGAKITHATSGEELTYEINHAPDGIAPEEMEYMLANAEERYDYNATLSVEDAFDQTQEGEKKKAGLLRPDPVTDCGRKAKT